MSIDDCKHHAFTITSAQCDKCCCYLSKYDVGALIPAAKAAEQTDRCKHGVWAADRCEQCVTHQPVGSADKWEDVHLQVCKDDQYKGLGHRCISFKGVIYYPERESQQPVDHTTLLSLCQDLAMIVKDGHPYLGKMSVLIQDYLRQRRRGSDD